MVGVSPASADEVCTISTPTSSMSRSIHDCGNERKRNRQGMTAPKTDGMDDGMEAWMDEWMMDGILFILCQR